MSANNHQNLFERTRKRQATNGRSQQRYSKQGSKLSLRQQLVFAAGAIASFAVFYLTPISELVTNELLLPMVPLESDYEMGRQALQDLPYTEVYKYTWSPLVKSVSKELIQTFDGSSEKRNRKYDWDVAIVRSDAINAFALPGGVIRVTDTLLDAIKPTRGELAALIGHEMGHVIHRHSQARVLQSKVVSWITQALIYDDKDDTKENFGQALGELLAKSAAWLGQQRFSRLDEYQADATSWELLVDASSRYGYNPQSLQSLLGKLLDLEKGRSGSKEHVASVIENWSRTHPATEDRLGALEQKWKALPLNERKRMERNKV